MLLLGHAMQHRVNRSQKFIGQSFYVFSLSLNRIILDIDMKILFQHKNLYKKLTQKCKFLPDCNLY